MRQRPDESVRPVDRSSLAILAAVMAAAVCGCGSQRFGGAVALDRVIYDLRGEKIALNKKIEVLEQQAKLRLDQIVQLEQQLKWGTASDDQVAAVDLPRVVAIRFDRYSGPLDTNADSRDDMIRLYVHTLDQHGRFLPAAGSAQVQAVSIQADQTPTVFAQQSLTGPQWDQAYRSSYMGTHYRLQVMLPPTWPGGTQTVTVKLTFTDAATGATFSYEQPMQIREGMKGSASRRVAAPADH